MAFQTLSKLNTKIVEELTLSWNGRHPKNILSQLEEDKPWVHIYATSDTYGEDMKHVTLDNKEIVVYNKEGKKSVKTFNWIENEGVLSDGNIRCYVQSIDALAYAYYICDIEGPSGPAQGGVAMAFGPPGGLPNETLYMASLMKKDMKKMKIKLNVKCDINIPPW
uniref:Uncharacterized protein n=1 Tax=Cuerna arida TaxID=1464854 RepID=A0A1B6FDW4_9HEMI